MHLIFFKQSKVVIGGKYTFVLITVLHAWPIALISTSVSQKITLNNVQNRRVLVKFSSETEQNVFATKFLMLSPFVLGGGGVIDFHISWSVIYMTNCAKARPLL